MLPPGVPTLSVEAGVTFGWAAFAGTDTVTWPPALVVAVVALIFACAGSAVAGSLITGAQIKDGSITVPDKLG